MNVVRRLTLGFSLACAAATSYAGVLVEQQVDESKFGFFSRNMGQQLADDFTLAASADVTSIKWFGFMSSGPQSDSFDILFFDDASGMPETIASSGK